MPGTLISISPGNKDEWRNPEFWTDIIPFLSISSNGGGTSSVSSEAPSNPGLRKRLQEQGFGLYDVSILPKETIELLRKGIEALDGHQLPASFVLLFDEAWQLARASKKILSSCCSPTNKFHWDILAWCIANEGFSPHRDRQPDDVAASFEGKDPKFVTQWIALSDATPENSCLYVIPKPHDPGYTTGDVDNPLQRALPNKQSYQRIRALPRKAGQSILFSHRIIHWGSARDITSTMPPRIAISFVSSSLESPYLQYSLETENSWPPPFHIRLLLVCTQLLAYYQRFDLPVETLRACRDYCVEHTSDLNEEYRTKITLEFAKAMKEVNASMESSEEDDLLEEMLNAEENGEELEDDYEDMENTEGSDRNIYEADEDDEDDNEDQYEGMSLFYGTKTPSEKKQRLS